MMLANLSSALQVASGGDFTSEHVEAPELRALLENFVSSSDDLAYATLLNADAKGISAGRIAADAFLQRELERAYAAAREGRVYNGEALVVGTGKSSRTVVLVSTPVMVGGRFVGMIGSVVDLQFLIRRLQEVSRGGLTPYVVDSEGRLVAGAASDYATGQDMTNLEIVRSFVELGSKATNGGRDPRIQCYRVARPSSPCSALAARDQPGLGCGRAKAASRSLPRRV